MKVNIRFYLVFLIVIGQALCQQQIQLGTQVGESNEVDLTQYFSIISTTFQVASSSQSAFTLDNAFTQVSEGAQVNYTPPVAFDQILLSETQQQRVEITTSDTGFTVSLYLITKSSPVSLTLTAKNTILSKKADKIGKVTLIKQNVGFFTYSLNNISQAAYFYLDQSSVLQISVPGGSSVFQNLNPSYPVNINSDNSIYFVSIQTNDANLINLYLLQANGDFKIVSNIDIPCDLGFTPQLIQNGLNLVLLCQSEDSTETDLYSIYFGNSQLSLIKASQPLYEIGTIFDIQFYKGNHYIFHQKPGNQSILYFTKVFINGPQLIQSQSVAVEVFNSSGNYIKVHVQNEKYITIITSSQLIGFDPNTGKVLTLFNTPVIDQYTIQGVIQAFEISILTYQQKANYQQLQIQLQQPKIRFSQLNQEDQAYQISLMNSLQSQTLNVVSNTLTNDKTGLEMISVLSSKQYQQLIAVVQQQQYEQQYQYLNVEEYVLGSNMQVSQNLTPTYNQLQLLTGVTSLSLMKETTTDFNPQQTVKKSLKSINYDIVNIYSTQQSVILVESLTQNQGTERQITLVQVQSDVSSNSAQLSTADQITVPTPLSNVDSSGFFAYVNNQSYYIKIFTSTGNSYQFYDISTSCQQSDTTNFSFTADSMNNIIVIFCNNQMNQVKYSYDSKQQILIAQTTNIMQINNLITYPIKQLQASVGILTVLDNTNSIQLFNYLNGYSSQKIAIPAQADLTIQNIYLYSQSFLVTLKDTNNNITIQQFSYQMGSDQKSARYLRVLNTSTVGDLNLASMKPLRQFKTNYFFYVEEYFLIASSDQKTLSLYRLNNVRAQNQLYQQFQLSFQLTNLNFLYFSEDTIGIMNGQNQFTSYFLSESIMVVSLYKIVDQSLFDTQLNYQFTNQLTINTNNNFAINYLVSKDVSADYAVIYLNNQKVQQIENYFAGQDIVKSQQQLSANLQGLVNSNLFGWEITYKTGIPQGIVGNISQLLSIDNTKSQPIFDQVQLMDNYFAYSIGNKIYIGGELYTSLEEQYTNCNLYIDQSTVVTKSDALTTETSLTLNALCYSQQNQQLLLDNIQFQGTYTIASKQTTYKATDYTFVGKQADFFLSKTQVISIYTDNSLGPVMVRKLNQVNSFISICKYTTSTQNQQLAINCTFDTSQQINALAIVNSVWIQTLSKYIYVSANGYIYTDLAKNIQQINLLGIDSINQQALCTKCSITSVGQSSVNSLFVQLNSVQIFELIVGVSQDQSIPFTITITNTFYGEQGLSFTGYGIAQSNSNYIMIMQSIDLPTQFIITLYQSYNNQKINNSFLIQGSQTLTLDLTFYSGVFKIFSNNGQISYISNSFPTLLTKLQLLNVQTQNTISLQCTSNKSSINGVGAYVQILGTVFNAKTTIPLNVQVIAPKSYSTLLSFSVVALVTFLLSLV